MRSSTAKLVVAHLIEGDTPGGAERLVIQFAEELRRRGHEIVTIIPAGGAAWLGHEMARRGFPWATVPRRSMLNPSVTRDLVRILREHQATAIHSHEFIGVRGALAARALRLPHVITMHGSDYFAERWRRRVAFRWALRCSALVGVSRATSEHAEQCLGLARGTATTIANGIAPRPGDRHVVRESLAIAPDELVVGAVGNVSERKNHVQLLEALLVVAARQPALPWHMVVAGEDRGCMVAIRSRAESMGVASRIHLLGYRADTENVLAAMDVFAMPSLHEGMPLAILEAMFARLPVIASNTGGVADMLADGAEGLLHPVGDTPALAAALESLLTDPARRARLAAAGAARAERQHGVDAMMDAYERLYDR